MQDGRLFPEGTLGQERGHPHLRFHEEPGEFLRCERPDRELVPRNKLRMRSQFQHDLWRDVCETRTPAVTPPPRAGRTTPGPARSPARPAEARPSWPGTSATAASPTPCAPRPCQPSPDHQERAPITTASAPAAPATTPRSAS